MIDIEAYTRRIGYSGPREPTYAVLAAVCALHPAHIPYENIDPLLGITPSIEPAAVATKLVQGQRGGYCFEQNLLLLHALRAMGFEVSALAARVVWMRPADAPLRPRTHMLLRVQLPPGEHSGTYVADAGFGGNLMDTPLRLEPDTPQRTPHALLRFTRAADADTPDAYTIETRLPAGWAPMYRFTLEPQGAADYEPLNWYTATHPGSIFRHNLLMERCTPELRVGLFNDRLVQRRPGLPPITQRLATRAAFEEALPQHFGIDLPRDTVGLLHERVPKGLDQFVVPDA